MNIARSDFTAALLPDGKVLVIGGRLQNGDATKTTEIYDPNKQSWLIGDQMKYPRQVQSDLQDRPVFFED